MVACIMDSEFPTKLTMRLAHELGSNLDKFSASWQLYSGLGMERLWSRFKPSTAKNIGQHDISIQVEELANRFDDLMWASGASLHELSTIRESLVQTHDNIIQSTIHATGPMQVCKFRLEVSWKDINQI